MTFKEPSDARTGVYKIPGYELRKKYATALEASQNPLSPLTLPEPVIEAFSSTRLDRAGAEVPFFLLSDVLPSFTSC